MTELTLQSIPVATTCADEDGRLVLADGRLVAVLVRLADAVHEEAQGRWHLEAGFGQCMAAPVPFADLPEALAWVATRLGLKRDTGARPGPGRRGAPNQRGGAASLTPRRSRRYDT